MSDEPINIEAAYRAHAATKLTTAATNAAAHALQGKWYELDLPRGADAAKNAMLMIFSSHIYPNIVPRPPANVRQHSTQMPLMQMDFLGDVKQAETFGDFISDLRQAEHQVITLFREHPVELGIKKVDETILIDAVRGTFNAIADAAIGTVMQRGR